MAIIDRRGANPSGSPRGKNRTGRSYRDLTTLSWTQTSPDGNGMDEPPVEESAERLRARKAAGEDEGKIGVVNGGAQALESRAKRE